MLWEDFSWANLRNELIFIQFIFIFLFNFLSWLYFFFIQFVNWIEMMVILGFCRFTRYFFLHPVLSIDHTHARSHVSKPICSQKKLFEKESWAKAILARFLIDLNLKIEFFVCKIFSTKNQILNVFLRNTVIYLFDHQVFRKYFSFKKILVSSFLFVSFQLY